LREVCNIINGSRKSFHIHNRFMMTTVALTGSSNGNTTWRKVCGIVHPSMVAASSKSTGMDFTNPWYMNIAMPTPRPI
jgi:hypothetical protein